MSENREWLEVVAGKAGVSPSEVEGILARKRITPAPLVATPRRLTIQHISFSGEKSSVVAPGPFRFEWNNLDCGLWAMVTDMNLRGKSSVIEVVRWMIRGRSSSVREDVRLWISNCLMRFLLDGVPYEVSAETSGGGAIGSLSLVNEDGKLRELVHFNGENEFESAMSDFFMREFGLETLTSWQSKRREDGEKSVISHNWPFLSGVLFIGTDYSSILGDVTPVAGLGPSLLLMYLGLPWVSTLTAAQASLKGVKHEQEVKERQRKANQAAREARVETVRKELEAKRQELDRTPSDSDVRAILTELSAELAKARNEERNLLQRLEGTTLAVSQAENAYAEDRRELQSHLDAEAAGAVFRMLDPSFCPRCDTEITAERREKEKSTHSCSICGEQLVANEDAEAIRTGLQARIKGSKDALNKARKDLEFIEGILANLRLRVVTIDSQMSKGTIKLNSFGVRNRLEVEVAALEARLDEAAFEYKQDEIHGDEETVLDAVVKETIGRIDEQKKDLLEAVSRQLVVYARQFGMKNLDSANLKGNLNLFLSTGGADTSYSKVTKGEQLRLKVATVLAMIRIAEERGVGRHPGLLMIDSPGAQEVAPDDLDHLMAGLAEVAKEFSHLQVFIAARASEAVLSHIPDERMLIAHGEDALW